jgi:hypothetical protein
MKSKTLVAGLVTSLVCTLGATGVAVPVFANPTDTVDTSPAVVEVDSSKPYYEDLSSSNPYFGAVGTLTLTKITKTHVTHTDEAGVTFTRPLEEIEIYSQCVRDGKSKAKWAKKNPNTSKYYSLSNKLSRKCERLHITPDTRPELIERPVKASEVYINAKGQTVFPLNRRINFNLMTVQELNWLSDYEYNKDLNFINDVADRTIRAAPKGGDDSGVYGSNYAEVTAIIDTNRVGANAYFDTYKDDAWMHMLTTGVPRTTFLRDYTLYEYPLVIGVEPWVDDPRLTLVKPWTVEQGFKLETRETRE